MDKIIENLKFNMTDPSFGKEFKRGLGYAIYLLEGGNFPNMHKPVTFTASLEELNEKYI